MKPARLFVALSLSLATALPAMAACSDPAGPGVDWRNCSKPGAELADADLSDANLKGADLRNADLTGANLTGANLTGALLSGADLMGADLTAALLDDADLTETTWTDGTNCGDGNVLNRSRIGTCPN